MGARTGDTMPGRRSLWQHVARATSGSMLVCAVHLDAQETRPTGVVPVQIADSASTAPGSRFLPTAKTLARAGTRALTDEGTWIPALAAGVIIVGGWDQKISRWSLSHPRVFRNPGEAAAASDDFRAITQIMMVTTALFAQDDGRFWMDRLERLFWEHAGLGATYVATNAGKSAFRRLRPDESNRRSFPSGHSSFSFAAAAASARNFHDIDMPYGFQLSGAILSEMFAGAAAWSRVEAGVHYPTDILVGAALGNALSVLSYELYRGNKNAPVISARPGANGTEVGLSIRVR